MGTLDLSEALLEPTFQDDFIVKRRLEVVGDNGRSTITVTNHPTFGIITPSQGNSLSRGTDEQHAGKGFTVRTQFALRGESQVNGVQFQPDIIFWQGNYFLVNTVRNYMNWGEGWIIAELESTNFVDEAPQNVQ